MDLILMLLLVVVFLLAVLSASLYFYWHATDKRINTLLEKGKIKDFKEILLSHKEKNTELQEKLKEAFTRIKDLEKISKITIQKVGIVRFNPFNDMGGNQSFVIAMLDDNNDGFVLSSLFVKDGNRVYAKSVKAGKSEHVLSKEELDALSKAINHDN